MLQIESINIKNFKNLDDVTINPAKLNLLFGANASGKSSIMKAIYFLFQNYDNFGDLNLSFYNGLDLDSFDSLLGNSNNKSITYTIIFDAVIPFFRKDIFFNSENLLANYNKYKSDGYKELYSGMSNAEAINNILSKNIIGLLKYHYDKEIIINRFGDVSGFESYIETCSVKVKMDIVFKQKGNDHIKEISISELDSENIFYSDIDSSVSSSTILNSYLKEGCEYKKIQQEIYKIDGTVNKVWSVDFYTNPFRVYGSTTFQSLLTFLDIIKYYKSNKSQTRFQKFLDKYYRFSIFMFFLYEYLPRTLSDIKNNIIYCKTVRELPKRHYDNINGKFQNKSYMGLLNRFESVQNEFSQQLKKIKADELNVEDFEIDLETVPSKHYTFNKLNLKRFSKFVTDSSTKSENMKFYKLTYIDLHRSLIKLGFKKIIFIDKNKDIGKLMSYDVETGKVLNFMNESSGLQQIFPILLCHHLYQISLIEQPELHLHPALQSKLALIFTDFSTSYINSRGDKERGARFNIIESHSEHFVRKLQVLVGKKKINKDDVRVSNKDIRIYFLNSNNAKSKIEEIRIKENGLLEKDWPFNFFDESMELTLDMLENLSK